MDPNLKSSHPLSSEVSRVRVQPATPPNAAGSSISVDEIYYTLFRHKGKIIVCTLIGLIAAGGWLSYRKFPYVSDAKLFVRYVVVEGMTLKPGPDDAVTKSPDMRGETIISSEQQILTSLDLIKQVAQGIGPEKILAAMGGGNDINAATIAISKGLTAEAPKFSSVISLSFRHPDPEIVQPVLRELIALYFKKHVEIHRSAGMVGDFLAQETDQLRTRLAQTEDNLRKAKAKAGVVSLEEAKKSFSDQMAKLRDQIFTTQAELVERQSFLQELTKYNVKESPAAKPATGSVEDANPVEQKTENPLTPALIEEYRTIAGRLESLRKREQELLIQFTAENPRVREVRTQLADAQSAKQKLESEHPLLSRDPAATVTTTTPAARDTRFPALDPMVEASHITALQAKLKALMSQVETLRSEVATLETLEGSIQELMRKKELEEAHYRRYAASLEQSRINEAMGAGKVSNLIQIQTPSPPTIDAKKATQIPAGLAFGGMALGLAWAFLIEFVLDHSVRRASDVENKLRLPLFITIPELGEKTKRRWLFSKKKAKTFTTNAPAPLLPPDTTPAGRSQALATLPFVPEADWHPFHETLRDRLIGYFESRGLTHKPKLVAVTGLNKGAGVTTTAAGLARSLSQTGDGNVLLVDLTPGQGAAHQFVRGKVLCGLDEVLTGRDQAQVENNLFVVSSHQHDDRVSQLLPHRFRNLVPKLKASDFDYIIFDMPPVSQISITPRLAGFMDMMLIVMESEKTRLDLVQRATDLLAESKAHVGVVLNKTHSYIPKQIHQEDLGYS